MTEFTEEDLWQAEGYLDDCAYPMECRFYKYDRDHLARLLASVRAEGRRAGLEEARSTAAKTKARLERLIAVERRTEDPNGSYMARVRYAGDAAEKIVQAIRALGIEQHRSNA